MLGVIVRSGFIFLPKYSTFDERFYQPMLLPIVAVGCYKNSHEEVLVRQYTQGYTTVKSNHVYSL